MLYYNDNYHIKIFITKLCILTLEMNNDIFNSRIEYIQFTNLKLERCLTD